ncbi:MAG: hypothetical protein IT250_09170 [Chitinophagaceae bacterium]|nr:hypothetical protein [Chitinophagaceae bacterium]
MTYPLIALGLTVVFVVYLLYLLLVKKDKKTVKDFLYPGLFFIAVWTVVYFLWIK